MAVVNFKQMLWVFFILITAPTCVVGGDDSVTNTDPSPPPSTNSEEKTQTHTNFSPFKQPSIAVIVGVLTAMFSITLLLLLYTKHCKREIGQNAVVYGNHAHGSTPGTGYRKNSGIERAVIELLPIFRFSSLSGQKDGLECAVCLARFEATEVLRLLPKCKHVFHVECIDTWLDSHSTCPLCRHRVDPEDVLLNNVLHPYPPHPCLDTHESGSGQQPDFIFSRQRVSGRHSSAGELSTSASNSLESSLFRNRKSLDGARFRFSYKTTKKNESTNGAVAAACFDHRPPLPRKDCSLLTDGPLADRKSSERRFEHRIIISARSGGGAFHNQRWSDVHPSDLLYVRSEMIISDSRRFSSPHSRPPSGRRQQQQQQQRTPVVPQHNNNNNNSNNKGMGIDGGSGVINSRSVSEITGLSRFPNNRESNGNRSIINRNRSRQQQQQRQAQVGLVSRWLAWISSSHLQPQLLPAVRPDRTNDTSSIV